MDKVVKKRVEENNQLMISTRTKLKLTVWHLKYLDKI